MRRVEGDDVMTGAEVAAIWRVDPKTVIRWVKAGKIPPEAILRTLGGHRRYYRSEIEKLLNGGGP